jgi:hypothetical protein
MVRENLRVA